MPSTREAFENGACPVADELLGKMYRASEHGLETLIASVSSDVRAMLALFCYRRAHLHELALTIAASCDQRELIEAGGRAGSVLFALARQSAPRQRAASSSGSRKAITLSTAPLTSFAPLDPDIEPDALEPHAREPETLAPETFEAETFEAEVFQPAIEIATAG
jgi:hypothetical protein